MVNSGFIFLIAFLVAHHAAAARVPPSNNASFTDQKTFLSYSGIGKNWLPFGDAGLDGGFSRGRGVGIPPAGVPNGVNFTGNIGSGFSPGGVNGTVNIGSGTGGAVGGRTGVDSGFNGKGGIGTPPGGPSGVNGRGNIDGRAVGAGARGAVGRGVLP